ncbi:hypothetical protein NXF25_011213, partial [Crotalus adamanteus]
MLLNQLQFLLKMPGMGNPVKFQVGHLSWVRLWGWTMHP